MLNMSGLDKAEHGEWKISADVVDSMLAVESTSEVETVSGEAVSAENVSSAEPEIISENTTENNTLTMNMGNCDFVINMEMCDSGAYPYMIVEVTNEGNRIDSATLKLYDTNDTKKEYGSRNISSLAPGKTKLFKININADWADANGKVAVLAFVEDSSNEIYTYNNYSYQYISLNYGTFHIVYELNGGQNNAENPTAYTTADTISLKDPSMSGYTFGGWYTSSTFDLITKVTEISSGNAQDIVLYAKWTKTDQDKDKDAENKDNSGKEVKNNGASNSSQDVKLLKKGVVKELTKYNAVVKNTKSGNLHDLDAELLSGKCGVAMRYRRGKFDFRVL